MRTAGDWVPSALAPPLSRDGERTLAQAWKVHALRVFPETEYALRVGFWWLTPEDFGVAPPEIADLAANLGAQGVAVAFLTRHFGPPRYEWMQIEELDLVPVGDRVGRRVRVEQANEYVVIPVREGGVLVGVAYFHRGARFEREEVWPRIVASIRIREELEGPD